jgi:gamma-glutamylcyclotransferase (GGCT)/AIG2-like uncharacterized protein YtfP
MTANIFVYGTLVSAASGDMGANERKRLREASQLLGPATLQGRLYHLGRYPGAVETADPDALVHGEVMRLADPAATLAWLDAYEGIRPGDPDPEYARRICPVWLADGSVISAWVYLYRWSVRRGRLIANGRWTDATAS